MPTTSIVIPAFNQAGFLAQAIESALAQSDATVETIVVDDGSTDETPEVVDSFQGRPGFSVIRQANQGLPAARNRGAAAATGDYLCFLDSDDWLHPEKTSLQVALLEADSELGFIYSDIITVDQDGRPLEDQYSVAQSGRVLSGDIFPSLVMGGYFPPLTVTIRRSVFERTGGFDEELGGHADYDLWLRAAAGHRACFLPQPLAYYRVHAASMSRDGAHMAATRKAALQKLARLYPDRLGAAVHGLQQANEDLHRANQWLNRNCDTILSRISSAHPTVPAGLKSHFFLQHLHQARLVRGHSDQLAVWEATMDGVTSKALYLHAPAEVVLTVPVGRKGQLSTAVCLHPDAWEKPGGGCEFHLRVDDRVAFLIAIDPVHLPSDRHWHEIRLDVPENTNGRHTVTLETRAVGTGSSYRWALWRHPEFLWSVEPETSLGDKTTAPAPATT